MRELIERAKTAENRLSDLDAPVLSLVVASSRELLENEPESEQCSFALLGAIIMAEAVVEQLTLLDPPRAEDGEIVFRHAYYAPGKKFSRLIEQLVQARDEASRQRLEVASLLVGAPQSSVAIDKTMH